MTRARLTLLTLLVFALGSVAAAQTPNGNGFPAAAVGVRVRVRTATPPVVIRGVVAAASDSEITVTRDDGSRITIPMGSISTLEISAGVKRHWLMGLGLGLGFGLATGLTANVDSSNCNYSSNFCSRGGAVGNGTLILGALGAGVGMLIKTDRWVRQGKAPVFSARATSIPSSPTAASIPPLRPTSAPTPTSTPAPPRQFRISPRSGQGHGTACTEEHSGVSLPSRTLSEEIPDANETGRTVHMRPVRMRCHGDGGPVGGR